MGPGIAGSKRVIGWWSKTSKRGRPPGGQGSAVRLGERQRSSRQKVSGPTRRLPSLSSGAVPAATTFAVGSASLIPA